MLREDYIRRGGPDFEGTNELVEGLWVAMCVDRYETSDIVFLFSDDPSEPLSDSEFEAFLGLMLETC